MRETLFNEQMGKIKTPGISADGLTTKILQTGDPEFIKECCERGKELGIRGKNLVRLIEKTRDPDYIRSCVERRKELGLNSENIVSLLKYGLTPKDLLKECILKREEFGFSNLVVASLLNSTYDLEFNLNILRELKDVEATKIVRKSSSIEDIYEHLDSFLEAEGRTADKDTILRMYQKNHRILITCDFKILDYLKYFGEDKINLISCYDGVQARIFELSEPAVAVLASCISYYEKQYKTEEWTPLAETILNNINNKVDENFLQQISQQLGTDKVNMENLIDILINPMFRYITIEKFNNYEQMKEQKITELASDFWTDKLQNAILQKAFNHGLDRAKYLVEKYGEDIDAIEDDKLKKYISALKAITSLNDRNDRFTLRDIYNSIDQSQIKIGNTFAIEKLLKMEYAKLYNQESFKVEDAVRNEELGENVYEAGTDFSMTVTSVQVYAGFDRTVKNYYEDWNQPALECQHFCCSNIRNDMISTVYIPNICYGFERMEEDSFITADNGDAHSYSRFCIKSR